MLQEKILKGLSEEPYFVCKDTTVSLKNFELRYNKELDMFVTHPSPGEGELPEYYKSKDYISHTDSRKGFMEKLYQTVKSFMLNKKLKWIVNEKPELGKLLDIGAGTGDFLSRAEKKGWSVSGVEPNAAARELSAKKGIVLEEKTNSFPSHSFDVITMWHVLEHVPDLEKQILELRRLLKKEGLLIVAVPNFKSYDAYKYKNNWAAFDVPRHLWHFSQHSLKKIFREFSFGLKKVEPLKFDSYYVSLLSEKYTTGRANYLKAFFNGFLSNLVARRTKEYSSLVYFFKKLS